MHTVFLCRQDDVGISIAAGNSSTAAQDVDGGGIIRSPGNTVAGTYAEISGNSGGVFVVAKKTGAVET